MSNGAEENAALSPPPAGPVETPVPAPPAAPRGADAEVRLDKWLHVARVYKTRTLAGKACELSRVQVNGQVAKASRHLKVGDTVDAQVGDWKRKLVVRFLRDKPVSKAEALLLFEDLSGPRPVLDAAERAMRKAPVSREKGAGRPTKKDRRDLQRARFTPPEE